MHSVSTALAATQQAFGFVDKNNMPKPPDGEADYGCYAMTSAACAALVDAVNKHNRAVNRACAFTWPHTSCPAAPYPEFPLGELHVVDDAWRDANGTWREVPRRWTHRFLLKNGGEAILRVRNFVRRGEEILTDYHLNMIRFEDVEWAGLNKPCPIDHPDHILNWQPKTAWRKLTPDQKFRFHAHARQPRGRFT